MYEADQRQNQRSKVLVANIPFFPTDCDLG